MNYEAWFWCLLVFPFWPFAGVCAFAWLDNEQGELREWFFSCPSQWLQWVVLYTWPLTVVVFHWGYLFFGRKK